MNSLFGSFEFVAHIERINIELHFNSLYDIHPSKVHPSSIKQPINLITQPAENRFYALFSCFQP